MAEALKSRFKSKDKPHERPLPLLSNPVSHDGSRGEYGNGETIPLQDKTGAGYMEMGAPPTAANPAHPVFNQRDKSAPSELFYDLFFVANLTAFTEEHEMNSPANIRSYIGFFSLLWFTWLQVSLYDVRFSRDSVFDRICKALQLGIMMGFVFIGSEFDPREGNVAGHSFSLILMASRIILAIQYLVAFMFAKHYHTARMPFLVVMITLAVSAVIFFAVSFAFPPYTAESEYKIYALWYIVGAMEVVTTIFASIKWRSLSFKGTHIVERMSVLTLIILGEGVIGLAGSIQSALSFDITGNKGDVSSSFCGVVVAAVLVLYYLYMIYFDNLEEEHFGTIRQQIWIVMHYPLHVCFILFVEGNSQSVKWRRALSEFHRLNEYFDSSDLWRNVTVASPDLSNFDEYLSENASPEFFQAQADNLNNTLIWTYNQTAQGGGIKFYDILTDFGEVQESIETIANGMQQSTADVAVSAYQVYVEALSLVFGAMKIELPEEENESAALGPLNPEQKFEELTKQANGYEEIFTLVFRYFFIAGGCAMLVLGILAALSMAKGKRPGIRDYLRYVMFAIIGIVTAVVVPLAAHHSESYQTGPWVVPSVALLLFILVVFNHLL